MSKSRLVETTNISCVGDLAGLDNFYCQHGKFFKGYGSSSWEVNEYGERIGETFSHEPQDFAVKAIFDPEPIEPPSTTPYRCPEFPDKDVCIVCLAAMSQRDHYMRELVSVRNQLAQMKDKLDQLIGE